MSEDLRTLLYALADELDIDAVTAFEESMATYESRIDEAGTPGSDAVEE